MNTKDDDSIDLPAGFRFHPTDEELITHYLSPKSLDDNFATLAIGDADLNKVEPWDLPWKARFGEEEWYFFFERDRKYPTGLRTNRATRAGYWKATGKDKAVIQCKALIGMKKTLVFYRGRAPRGEKTNWVMHEYRLGGESSAQNRREWVLCRVFEKWSRGEKAHISGLIRNRACDEEDDARTTNSSDSPPLRDLSSSEIEVKNPRKVFLGCNNSHGTCFSDQEVEKYDHLPQSASALPVISDSNSIFIVEFAEDLSCPDSYMVEEDQSGLGILSENGNGEESVEQTHHHHQGEDVYGHDLGFKCSWEEEEDQVNLDCLWNY